LIQDLISGTLDPKDYPFIRESDAQEAQDSGPAKKITSLRNAKPSWQNKGKDGKADKPGMSGGRVIVFIAGGMTYSEMRTGYELTNTHKREVLIGTWKSNTVIVGSTHIVNPKSFVDSLRELKSAS
jgi:syntaxin-binding protein 1